MRRALAAIAVLATALVEAGCGHSPPMRYFTLDAIPAQGQAVATPPKSFAPVQLTAVHIPAIVDRPEVVTHVSANRLAVADSDRWGAPLGQMMRSVLAQDLSTRLPTGTFIFPDAPTPDGTRQLVVTVLALDAQADGALTLQAGWTLMAGRPNRAVLTRETTLAVHGAGSGATAQASALSQAIGQLSDRIAASLAAE